MDLLIERQGPALHITLNRPAALNALTRPMLAEFKKTLLKSSADPTLRVIVVTGSGRGFCVGADLAKFQEDSKSGKAPGFRQELEGHFHPISRAIRSSPQIVIAKINGPCAGAGMALALSCDLKFSLKTANFVAAFAKVGLGPDTGSSYLIAKAMGYSKGLEFFLTKGNADGTEMERWGTINKAVETSGALDEAVSEAIARISELPLQAVTMTKGAIQFASQAGYFEECLNYEAAMQEFLGKTQDHAEGMAAFLEKRKPVFKGC